MVTTSTVALVCSSAKCKVCRPQVVRRKYWDLLDRFLAIEDNSNKGAEQVFDLWRRHSVHDPSLNVLRSIVR